MLAITGATGQLGRLVIQDLLEKGTAPSEIVAIVRNPGKAADLAASGVEVRESDYTNPQALESALQGIERLLLISSSEFGRRFAHHKNVIDAAKKAGVGQIVYTSLTRADTSPMRLAEEHRLTEEFLRASGVPFVILRNGWYTENHTGALAQALEHGAIVGAAGEGRVSSAPRADYAAAAAAVLLGDGHEGKVYELAGDEAFTIAEMAAEVSRRAGKEVVYRDLPEDEYAEMLTGFGLPEAAAAVLADADARLAEGHLYVDSGDLSRLIGRPTTPMAETVAAALEPVKAT